MINETDQFISKIAGWDFESDAGDSVYDSDNALIYKKLQDHFKKFFLHFEDISRISGQLDIIVQDFMAEAGQIEQVAAILKEGAGRQTKDIQKSTKLIEDFTNKINEIYEKSRKTVSLAYDMQENNQTVRDSVEQLVLSQQRNDVAVEEIFVVIKRLIDKTQIIGEITKLIEKISSETNILGLNAKVEAVHAGVAGKGFAVVAEEIQRLSRESKEASTNISNTIESVTEEIDLLKSVMKKSQGIFEAQRESVNEVSSVCEKNSSFINTYINEQESFNSAFEKIKEDENILAKSISDIFSSVRDISATANEITSLTYNQNNSISLLSKLDEDLSSGVAALEQHHKDIRVVRETATKRKIAIIFDIKNEFFDPTKREAVKAAAVYGYDVAFYEPKSRGREGVIQMAGFIDEVIEKKYDALAISPIDDNLILQKLKQVSSMGTKIVFINSKLNGIEYVSYIQTNGIAAGAAAAAVVMGSMGNQGDVIVNTWADTQISSIEDRKNGFIDEITSKTNIQVHQMAVNSKSSQNEADQAFEAMLRSVPDARMIFLTNCDWGILFSNYLKKRRADIQVITMDFTKEIQDAMSRGLIHYAIGQRNYSWGSMVIDCIDKSIHNKPVNKYVDTGTYEANIHNMNIYKSFIG